MQSGMRSFRKCDVTGSIQAFDEALRLDPAIRPYLWQRGLSLYYAGDTTLAVWAHAAQPSLQMLIRRPYGHIRTSDIHPASQVVPCATPF